jgi:RNA polymerase sigma factor (sigma-70 family)
MTSPDRHQLKPLLLRALAGDVCAWNDFFTQVRRFLHAELQRYGGPNHHAPLDHSALVQSTLRRILEKLDGQFPDGAESVWIGRFLGWIKKILHNRRVEEIRQLINRPTVSVGSAIADIVDAQGHSPVQNRECIAVELVAALSHLPEKKRLAVELFWFEGLSDAEIGPRIGCSAGAVKTLRFRALLALRTPRLRTLLEECNDARS